MPARLAYLEPSVQSVLSDDAWHKACTFWREVMPVADATDISRSRPDENRWQGDIGQVLPNAGPLFPFDREFYAPGEYRNRVFRGHESWYVAKRYDSVTACVNEINNMKGFADYLRSGTITALLKKYPFRLNVVKAVRSVLHGRSAWLVSEFQPHDFTADDLLRGTSAGRDRRELVDCLSRLNSILRIETGQPWRGFAPKNVLIDGWKSDRNLILCDFERTSPVASCEDEDSYARRLEEVSFQMEEFVGVCDPEELGKIFAGDLEKLKDQHLLHAIRIPVSSIDSRRTAALLQSWFPEDWLSGWLTLRQIERARGWLRDAASPVFFQDDIYDPTILLDSICAELPVSLRLSLTRRVIESKLAGTASPFVRAMKAVAVGLSILDLVAEVEQVLWGRSSVDRQEVRRNSVFRLAESLTGHCRAVWPATHIEAVLSPSSSRDDVKNAAGFLVSELLSN